MINSSWSTIKEDVYKKVQHVMWQFAYEINDEKTRKQVKRMVENEFNPAILMGFLNQVVVTVDDSEETLNRHELVVQIAWKVNSDDDFTVVEFKLGPEGVGYCYK